LEVLEIELFDYINWYNNIRIHGALNYLTPVEYKALYFKTVRKSVTIPRWFYSEYENVEKTEVISRIEVTS